MSTGRTGWSRAAEAYAAGLFLLYAVLIFLHTGAPSLTDYANWTYQGVLLREHLLGHPEATHALKHYPVPNSLTTAGIGLVALVLPWLAAAKTWLVIQLGLCFLSLRFLLRTVNAPAVAWLAIPQAVFLNVNFWYGFMNFELGLAWLMLFAAALLRGARAPLLTTLLVLTYFTHMIPFCLCLLMLGLECWRTRAWARLTAALPAGVLTAWYVVGRFLYAGNADGQAGMQTTVRTYSAGFWLFKVNSYLKSFGYVNPDGLNGGTFSAIGLWVLLITEATLATAVGWTLIRAGRKGLRANTPGRSLWWTIVLLLPVFMLAPGAALGISDPGARVLQAALALGLCLCWPAAGRATRIVMGGAGALLTGAGLLLFFHYGGDPRHPLLSAVSGPASQFARVPNDDQNNYYGALDRGDLHLAVFPTGLFLNRKAEQPR